MPAGLAATERFRFMPSRLWPSQETVAHRPSRCPPGLESYRWPEGTSANGPKRIARPITAVLIMAFLSHHITVGVRLTDDLETAGLPDGQAGRPSRGVPGAVGDLDGEGEAALR